MTEMLLAVRGESQGGGDIVVLKIREVRIRSRPVQTARHSRMSPTVIRIPRMHGWKLRAPVIGNPSAVENDSSVHGSRLRSPRTCPGPIMRGARSPRQGRRIIVPGKWPVLEWQGIWQDVLNARLECVPKPSADQWVAGHGVSQDTGGEPIPNRTLT